MKRQLNYRDCLTNEMLLKRFKSQFDLVRFAIEEATGRIRAGHDAHDPCDDNIVTEVLDDIAEGRMGNQICEEECSKKSAVADIELEEVVAEVEEKSKGRKRVKV